MQGCFLRIFCCERVVILRSDGSKSTIIVTQIHIHTLSALFFLPAVAASDGYVCAAVLIVLALLLSYH